MYRGTGVSRGVRRTTWDRSLKSWELQILCFEEFFWGGNTLGLVPASLPHTLGYACTFYAPTSPPPTTAVSQKNPRAHKNKIGTSPPPPNPPPKKEEFYGHGFSCRKNAFFPGVHKIGAAISGPRIADTNFTDTKRIFLSFCCFKSLLAFILCDASRDQARTSRVKAPWVRPSRPLKTEPFSCGRP